MSHLRTIHSAAHRVSSAPAGRRSRGSVRLLGGRPLVLVLIFLIPLLLPGPARAGCGGNYATLDGSPFSVVIGETTTVPVVVTNQNATWATDNYIQVRYDLRNAQGQLVRSSTLWGTFGYPGCGSPIPVWGTFGTSGLTVGYYSLQWFLEDVYGTGSYSPTVAITVTSPPPSLSGLDPPAIFAGSSGVTLTVHGSNFTTQSAVRWNGIGRPTTFVSSTELRAALSASDLAAAGTAQVTIDNGALGGGASNAQALTITNPVPTLSGLSPTEALVGSGPVALTLTGTNFVPGAVVRWNGADRPTTFVSSTTLTASIAGSDLATAGTADVTVFTPAPGGGGSGGIPFSVTNPAPVLSGTSVSHVPAGHGDLSLTITGTGFTAGSIALWNGMTRPTTVVSATELRATIPGSDLATPGTAALTVFTPAPGGGTSTALLFTMVTPPTVQPGALTQDGLAVAIPLSWTGVPASPTIECGTTTAQTVSGPAGRCLYTRAGEYTLGGSYTLDAIPYSAPPVPVSIPRLSPNGIALGLVSNGRDVTNGTVNSYTIPMPLAIDVALTLPVAIGIPDPLDLGRSHVSLQREGAAPVRLDLAAGGDALHASASASLDAPGTYTVTLDGHTPGGTMLTASASLGVTVQAVGLQAGPLTQEGVTVALPVSWPDTPQVTEQVIDCGSAPRQTFTGPSGSCLYSQAGSYTVRGRFRAPDGTPDAATAPLPISIPSAPPTGGIVILTINGEEATDREVSTILPAAVQIRVTVTPPTGVGIPDPLDPAASVIEVRPDGGGRITAPLHPGADPSSWTAAASLAAVGRYMIALQGHTLGGILVTASATTTLAGSQLRLSLGEPTQVDPQTVSVAVRWPEQTAGTGHRVSCGTASGQSIAGPTGACLYTRPGRYTLVGRFSPEGGTTAVSTEPASVEIAALPPTGADLTLSLPRAGPMQEEPGSHPGARIYRLAPTVYPVDLLATLALGPPASGGVGIADLLDERTSTARLTLAAQADGRPLAAPPSLPLVLRAAGPPGTYTARATLRGFPLGSQALQTSGRYALNIAGQTSGGTPLGSQAVLILEEPPLRGLVKITGAEGPYPPARYSFRVLRIDQAVRRDRIHLTWTVTAEGAAEPIRTTQGNSALSVTFTEPGTYRVALTLRGNLSGSYAWAQDVTVLAPPGPEAPAIRSGFGGPNRPPVTYQLKPHLPPLGPGEQYRGITWSVDGSPLARGASRVTFTTPGGHQIGLEAQTTAGRTYRASATVTVEPNLPPTGTLECSRSRPAPADALLWCSAPTWDPDGRVRSLRWVVPELGLETSSASLKAKVPAPPETVTVELHLEDNSGATEVLSTPVNLARP